MRHYNQRPQAEFATTKHSEFHAEINENLFSKKSLAIGAKWVLLVFGSNSSHPDCSFLSSLSSFAKESHAMGQPYVGEIRSVGFNFAPVDWSMCNGSLLAISQNPTLFQLIGTTYGGDGQNTFQLPDLRSRIPVHQGVYSGGGNYVLGQPGGAESVTITSTTYPTHNHPLQGSLNNSNFVANPGGNAAANAQRIYSNAASDTTMANSMVSMSSGGTQPHNNIQPYLTLTWIISLFGIFPSQS